MSPNAPNDHRSDDTVHDEEEAPAAAELVLADQDEPSEPQSEIDEPARLLRIAAMTKSMLNEVKTTDLDEAGRERLRQVHNRALEALSGLVSEDLKAELSDVALVAFEDSTPSAAELRIAQAQLAGWLEGLFRGIQASMAHQQLAAQAQLQQMRQQPGGGPGGGPGGARSGQYL